ncbi:MAG: hypothetical protein O3A37_05680 [Planctomycetota bacterium]|jgi:hypothetical protein|nr:hypothetical protein [Planctomycetota bacterium]
MTKSEFGYFCAGVAAGALGHKFYPEMKDKLAPYMAGAMVFAQQAFGNAIKDAMQTVEAMQQSGESVGADFFKAAAGAAAANDSDTAAA